MKKNRPQFFALMKDFNNGEIRKIDVLSAIWYRILTEKNTLRKREFTVWKKDKRVPVTTREQLYEFVELELKSEYWARCQYEFICLDWPYRDEVKPERDGDKANLIDINRPVKIDVYDQLEPNMDFIVDLVWDFIKDKIK